LTIIDDVATVQRNISMNVDGKGSKPMRLQLALNVADLQEAVEFYTRMFGVGPAKTKPGYANFAIDQPPLKLVLFEGGGESGSINHLGVETETAAEVVAAEIRLGEAGLETSGVDDTVCCYAEKTETWVHGPDGTRWEWYVKTADAEQLENVVVAHHGGGPGTICCAS
jgi:catechol 2,3-dioxygenase-like lactoylglutathione lyase family enzyme